MFLGSGNLMALSQRLHHETGSEKFKMVAAKPDISVSVQDSREIPTTAPCFRGQESQLGYQKGAMSKSKVTHLKNKCCNNYSKLHALYTSLTNSYNYTELVN